MHLCHCQLRRAEALTGRVPVVLACQVRKARPGVCGQMWVTRARDCGHGYLQRHAQANTKKACVDAGGFDEV